MRGLTDLNRRDDGICAYPKAWKCFPNWSSFLDMKRQTYFEQLPAVQTAISVMEVKLISYQTRRPYIGHEIGQVTLQM